MHLYYMFIVSVLQYSQSYIFSLHQWQNVPPAPILSQSPIIYSY